MRIWLASALVCAVACGGGDKVEKLAVDPPAPAADPALERWALLGDWYYGRGMLDKAQDAYARAGQRFNAGAVAQQRGDYAAAEAHYLAALREAKTPAVLTALASLARARGRYREALDYLNQAGTGVDVAVERGVVLGMLRRYDEADAAFAAALAAGDDNVRVHLAYGPMLNERGRYADALEHYERARALVQDDASRARALVGAGYSQLGLGNATAAQPLLEDALAMREANATPLSLVAEARFGLALAVRDADPTRALALARAALAELEAAGEVGIRQLPDVQQLIDELGTSTR